MIKSLIEFDVKTWLKSPSTILIFIIWSVLILFSLSNGSQETVSRQKRIDSLKLVQSEKFLKHKVLMDSFDKGLKEAPVYWDDARNAYYIGNYYGTRHLTKPVYNFAAIATGQSDLHYTDHLITTSQEYWFCALRKAEKLDNPINNLYGRFDLSFLLVWLLPLLIVVLTYNILSGEAEQGTLKMLLTEGLSVRRLLITKSCFRYGIIMCFSFLVIFLGAIFFAIPIFNDVKAFFVFLFSVLIYGAFWILCVVYVNLFKKSSDYNAGQLLIIWILLVLVFPALINVLISNIHPIPGKVTLIDKVRDKFTENDQKNSQILDQFYTDHPQFAISDSSKVMPVFMYKYMIKEMNTSEELQPLMSAYKSKMESQAKLTTYFGFFVPSMGLQETLEELSGHSLSQYLEFENYTDSENRKWRNHFHPLSLANRYLTISQYENLPNPVFNSSLNSGKISKTLTAMVILNILLTLLITAKVRRYKIE